MKLVGANPSPKISGFDPLPGQSHYLVGNDRRRWRTGVPHYAAVRYENIYPGIDLIFRGTDERHLEFDFVVAPRRSLDAAGTKLPIHPDADPGAIRLGFAGADRLELDSEGNLSVELPGGGLRLLRPRIYQDERPVGGGFVLRGAEVGFEVGPYDPSEPLVIDPVVIAYSTYFGGSGDDVGVDVAVDSTGNAYLTGFTQSVDFPAVGALQASLAGSFDAFVAKLNPAGTAIIYSTYLGGSGEDLGLALAVDASGSAYLAGSTASTNFPTTPGALDTGCGTDAKCNPDSATPPRLFTDAFIAKLNPAGTALLYSTYLGGSADELANDIALDSAASVYVTGTTASSNFPTLGPFQVSLAGPLDAFVAKLNPAGSALVYSTYLGGSAGEEGFGIAVDSTGSAYLTGVTSSTSFPTAAPFQAAFGGLRDAFVTKLNPAGSALVYSTYLGGNDAENSFFGALAVDAAGNAYVTGSTLSTNFPLASPLQAVPGGAADAFVAKLNAAGSALAYSTYLGGAGDDDAFAIGVDSAGVAHVAGLTESANFPTASPVQATLAGPNDAFLAHVNAAGSALAFSTYLGGSDADQALGLALGAAGRDYLVGATSSANFPTVGPIQRTLAGASEAFLAKLETPTLSNPLPTLAALAPTTATAGGPGFTLMVAGTNFVATTVARWNGSDRATTLLSSTELQAFIPATDIAIGGTIDVTVFNPPPRGGSSNAIQFPVGDFALGVSPASVTVNPGQAATYMLTLSPQFSSFNREVVLGCAVPLPALTSCSFSPRTLTPGASPAASTLTVATAAAPAAFAPIEPPPRAPLYAFWLALLSLALLALARYRSRLARPGPRAAALLLLLAVVSVQLACVRRIRPETPAGTYTITITATSAAFRQTATAEFVVAAP